MSDPPLPQPRGKLSRLVTDALADPPREVDAVAPVAVADPLDDDDLHLALYCCYELHYRSFAGVDPAWEWHPSLIALRRVLEATFLEAVRAHVAVREGIDPEVVGRLLFELGEDDPAPSLAEHLQRGLPAPARAWAPGLRMLAGSPKGSAGRAPTWRQAVAVALCRSPAPAALGPCGSISTLIAPSSFRWNIS